ncbi:PKD domain-containing protein [Micromonospora robiginosa]|uniref:PKD domain-containing protein n=1 Tax=Micromonospora robiginosa TaxID=2749844 RepID=A0A7L6BA36_9ACTN|nr:PKD domain-containing protein [Micromonospora ferruginea]QLQ38728.1 PKD domain-containing protein [Micromonospora ferruginea]
MARSGTPDQPITIRNTADSAAAISGPTAGVVIDGQHDIVLQDLWVMKLADLPAVDLRDAAGITVQGGVFSMSDASTAPLARLAGVTRSTLTGFRASGAAVVDGLILDDATTDVEVRSVIVSSPPVYGRHENSVGIRVDGPGNRLVNNVVNGFSGAGVALGPEAADTVVVNTQMTAGGGFGIHNHGALRTAITNNTVQSRCRDGIRVDGASTGTSIQNNMLMTNGSNRNSYCDKTDGWGAEIALFDDSGKRVTVDYNNTMHLYDPAFYSWNGLGMMLVAFRDTSGQAKHDKEVSDYRDREDSANSAAPGYLTTDRIGAGRADNPAVPNTGAGPVTYADRGAFETLGSPTAALDIALDLGASSVTLDASASTPGFVPLTTYVFDFGDGTVVTQAKPVASHTYARAGNYEVTIKVSGSDQRVATVVRPVGVLPRTGTVGLLALQNLRYTSAAQAGASAQADQPALGADGQFDLADAGNGQVALLSRATNRYLSVSATVLAVSTAVGPNETFVLLRNTDGTISLKATVNSRYVGVSSTVELTAIAPGITNAEKFYRVNVADANRTLKATVNGRYVSAESAGAKPLIANRATAGPWETFDLADLGSGQVGVFAHANNRFVCADNVGLNPLIANRTSAGAWEKFTVTRNADGTTSLKATINSRYVSADNVGTNPLIANRATIGLWEKFTLAG